MHEQLLFFTTYSRANFNETRAFESAHQRHRAEGAVDGGPVRACGVEVFVHAEHG